MWDKIKSELAALFGSQNSTLVAGVKSAVFDEMNALKTELTKAQGELATAKASLIEKTAALEKSQGELVTAQAGVVTLTADVEAAKKIGSQQALMITAAQGQPPIQVLPQTATGSNSSETKTRADFSALSPFAKTKFIKSGGKLTD